MPRLEDAIWEGSEARPDPAGGGSAGRDSAGQDWAVPWSDLMMVMFTLFVVLFATQALEREHVAGTPEVSSAPPPVVLEPPAASPVPGLVGDPAFEVIRDPDRSLRVRLAGPLFFERGSAALTGHAKQVLHRLSERIPRTQQAVHVVGHSDDAPIHAGVYPSNWELSASRAAAVVRHLVEAGGHDPARFLAAGRSHYEPVARGFGPGRHARNRRVEVVIAAPAPDDTRQVPLPTGPRP